MMDVDKAVDAIMRAATRITAARESARVEHLDSTLAPQLTEAAAFVRSQCQTPDRAMYLVREKQIDQLIALWWTADVDAAMDYVERTAGASWISMMPLPTSERDRDER